MTNGRILIVEKQAIVACDLTESLEMAGYEVCCVSDGVEALRTGRTFRPELAIVDGDVTGSPNAAETAWLLHEEHGAGLLYLTALPLSQRPACLAATLPLTFLAKPIRSAELLATAARAITMQRARRQRSLSPVMVRLAKVCMCSPTRRAALVPLSQ